MFYFLIPALFLRVRDIYSTVSPCDIYSTLEFCRQPMSREHIVPRQFLSRTQEDDLMNIFLTSYGMNCHRSSKRFGNIHNSVTHRTVIDGISAKKVDRVFAPGPDMSVCTEAMFMPPVSRRGAIARTCLYMYDKYPSLQDIIEQNVMDRNTLKEWLMYPIEDWEAQRYNNIGNLTTPRV